jgi:hypothetical protein
VILTVPSELKKFGVTDALVIGPGNYRRSGNTITVSGVGGAAAKVVATTKGYSSGSIGTISSWEIHLNSQASGGLRGKGPTLRVQHESAIINAHSTGASSSGYSSTDTWGIFKSKNGPVPAGDEIEIDMVIPKTRVAEFFINRPEPPASAR